MKLTSIGIEIEELELSEPWSRDIAPAEDAVWARYCRDCDRASAARSSTGAEYGRSRAQIDAVLAAEGRSGAAKRALDLRTVALGDPTHGPALRRLMTLALAGVRL